MSIPFAGKKEARFPGPRRLDFPDEGLGPFRVVLRMPINQESFHVLPILGFQENVGIPTTGSGRVKVNDLELMFPESLKNPLYFRMPADVDVGLELWHD
jgi:hypothetical protein